MNESVLVLGSGPIRIGQGIEFDYSCVHCVWALEAMGYRAIILNNNPETVSTDFDTGSALYFEPVNEESVRRIWEQEKPIGVVCQFGGQTAINLADPLTRAGITVLGTPAVAIAASEDRAQFEAVLERLNIARPRGRAVRSLAEAREATEVIGYPVLVRPSFVLGGRAMEIVFDADQLESFYGAAEAANPGQPVLIDQYLFGKEAEIDVICDGTRAFVPGIMEHVERAGIHSGDSMAVYPPVSLGMDLQARMVSVASEIALALGVRGLMNIQFVVQGNELFVLEVNPRASRTVPYLSKVTGVPMISLATKVMMGESLESLGIESGLFVPEGELGRDYRETIVPAATLAAREPWRPHLYAVKAPVFSFQKLALVEPSLGPEMKSTGEVLGIDPTYPGALYKALVGSHIVIKETGYVVLSLSDEDKAAGLRLAQEFAARGYQIAATRGTHTLLASHGITSLCLQKIQEGAPSILDLIMAGQVRIMINTPDRTRQSSDEGKRIRRACIEAGVACITSIDTALAMILTLDFFEGKAQPSCLPYPDYLLG